MLLVLELGPAVHRNVDAALALRCCNPHQKLLDRIGTDVLPIWGHQQPIFLPICVCVISGCGRPLAVCMPWLCNRVIEHDMLVVIWASHSFLFPTIYFSVSYVEVR